MVGGWTFVAMLRIWESGGAVEEGIRGGFVDASVAWRERGVREGGEGGEGEGSAIGDGEDEPVGVEAIVL